MSSSQLQRLLSLPLDRGRLVILTHDNPDPDTIASAAAMKLLLSHTRNINSDVIYSGIVGRAENRAMLEVLHLPMKHLSETSLADYGHIALIDAQPHTGNNAFPDDRIVDIVIDHHPLRQATTKARFYDVRPDFGASATMLTEYLRAAGVEIPRDLATALLYGIRSETHDLGREVADEDLDAYQYLFPRSDPTKLAAISRPQLPRRYYEQLSVALDSLEVGSSVAICTLGEVIDPDFVPEMADLAIRLEGMLWSFASGTYGDHLYLSLRTNDPTANAGGVMQTMLNGIGRGGGHGMRAGGNIDLKQSRPLSELQGETRDRFLQLVGATNERLTPLRSRPKIARAAAQQ
jgi:nanoRNase/pAp phosphatase (c-di-AMP/oligoRNAs hydrolase)